MMLEENKDIFFTTERATKLGVPPLVRATWLSNNRDTITATYHQNLKYKYLKWKFGLSDHFLVCSPFDGPKETQAFSVSANYFDICDDKSTNVFDFIDGIGDIKTILEETLLPKQIESVTDFSHEYENPFKDFSKDLFNYSSKTLPNGSFIVKPVRNFTVIISEQKKTDAFAVLKYDPLNDKHSIELKIILLDYYRNIKNELSKNTQRDRKKYIDHFRPVIDVDLVKILYVDNFDDFINSTDEESHICYNNSIPLFKIISTLKYELHSADIKEPITIIRLLEND